MTTTRGVAPLAVLDTGVVMSALIGSEQAASYRVMDAAGTGLIRVALSDRGLRELTRIVEEEEERIVSPARAFRVASDLWTHGSLHLPARREWPSLPDPNDWWLLDLAFQAEVDYIVAWDPHLFQATPPLPVEVVEPPVLLRKLDA